MLPSLAGYQKQERNDARKMSVITHKSDKICFPCLAGKPKNERDHAKYRQNLLVVFGQMTTPAFES